MSLIVSIILAAAVSIAQPIASPAAAATDNEAAEEASITGEVTYYAGPRDGHSSLMQRVWNWRLWKGHVPECPECVDAVALLEPQYIGRKVWLRHPDGEVVGPLMVVDCAEAKHRPNLRKRGWVADISYELAMQWRMAGPLKGVTVLFRPPIGPAVPGWSDTPLATANH
ncbi:MAG: hypothetical protein BWY52_01353 [Chloroflexi bacterium ADurb.Bin325]|nr:MAG: hypothetical protein BWY52_01353 [Chloroflexi bacterium ADurb.Bin325]